MTRLKWRFLDTLCGCDTSSGSSHLLIWGCSKALSSKAMGSFSGEMGRVCVCTRVYTWMCAWRCWLEAGPEAINFKMNFWQVKILPLKIYQGLDIGLLTGGSVRCLSLCSLRRATWTAIAVKQQLNTGSSASPCIWLPWIYQRTSFPSEAFDPRAIISAPLFPAGLLLPHQVHHLKSEVPHI